MRLTQAGDSEVGDEDEDAETIVAFKARRNDDLCPGSYMPAGCLVMHICRLLAALEFVAPAAHCVTTPNWALL